MYECRRMFVHKQTYPCMRKYTYAYAIIHTYTRACVPARPPARPPACLPTYLPAYLYVYIDHTYPSIYL